MDWIGLRKGWLVAAAICVFAVLLLSVLASLIEKERKQGYFDDPIITKDEAVNMIFTLQDVQDWLSMFDSVTLGATWAETKVDQSKTHPQLLVSGPSDQWPEFVTEKGFTNSTGYLIQLIELYETGSDLYSQTRFNWYVVDAKTGEIVGSEYESMPNFGTVWQTLDGFESPEEISPQDRALIVIGEKFIDRGIAIESYLIQDSKTLETGEIRYTFVNVEYDEMVIEGVYNPETGAVSLRTLQLLQQ